MSDWYWILVMFAALIGLAGMAHAGNEANYYPPLDDDEDDDITPWDTEYEDSDAWED